MDICILKMHCFLDLAGNPLRFPWTIKMNIVDFADYHIQLMFLR